MKRNISHPTENEISILDCTLRDGGYYNAWDFSYDLAKEYIESVAKAGVDCVEIGFRLLKHDRYFGPFAYSSEEFLSEFHLPGGVSFAVMVNADELLAYEAGLDEAIKLLFIDAGDSKVDMVRVAVHPEQLQQCGRIFNLIKGLGYKTSLNLMQISKIGMTDLAAYAETVKEIGSVDLFYIADSLGGMTPESVRQAIDVLQTHWQGPIGLHAHDNRSLALVNSMAAIETGAQWIDATILGMGRGAGNTRTESLLLELSQKLPSKYFPDAIFGMVSGQFSELKEKYHWGYNVHYHLSGLHGIHPTYVQEMLDGDRYDSGQVLDALDYLGQTKAAAFSVRHFNSALSGVIESSEGQWDATGWCEGEEVLIIGSGQSVSHHLNAIEHFISKRNPKVLCLNVHEGIPYEWVDAYIACHRTRILLEVGQYNRLKRPIILPLGSMHADVKEKLDGLKTRDYGMEINHGKFSVSGKSCVIPFSLAIAYALAIANAGGAKRILLAGFEGYEIGDQRQHEMIELLDSYKLLPDHVELLSLTPTSYPISERSIYSPRW